MRVPGQLHPHETAVAHVAQRRHHARGIEATLSEREMNVLAGPHVLDLHVGELRGVRPDGRGRVALAVAPHVAHVEREPERRVTDGVAEARPLRERRHVHAGLRLERRDEAPRRRGVGDRAAPFGEAASTSASGMPGRRRPE